MATAVSNQGKRGNPDFHRAASVPGEGQAETAFGVLVEAMTVSFCSSLFLIVPRFSSRPSRPSSFISRVRPKSHGVFMEEGKRNGEGGAHVGAANVTLLVHIVRFFRGSQIRERTFVDGIVRVKLARGGGGAGRKGKGGEGKGGGEEGTQDEVGVPDDDF